MDASNSPTTKPLYRGTQVVWYITGILEIALVFRFVFTLLGANTGAGFTSFVYTITEPLIIPFTSVFGISFVQGNLFEWTSLLAMIVYGLIGWGITRLLLMSKTVSTPEAASKLN